MIWDSVYLISFSFASILEIRLDNSFCTDVIDKEVVSTSFFSFSNWLFKSLFLFFKYLLNCSHVDLFELEILFEEHIDIYLSSCPLNSIADTSFIGVSVIMPNKLRVVKKTFFIVFFFKKSPLLCNLIKV